ncbi:DNA cytosine methyltransferase [Micromonospora sp. NBS 11-29]|uniref:DNA cytosine methyltransferase n=1 Tax=Micromonospora sp. NBS 11-29 TaxID=1960879 RepID=UPI0020CBB1CB|nr:DNA (cytosine-5-)-methyltransferase [Micromonospora sp. NBS 11-29]
MKIAPTLKSVPTGPDVASKPTAAEFFAGIGLVRLGLEQAGLSVVWSNDIEPAKQEMYEGHFGKDDGHVFKPGDVGKVKGSDMPSNLALAWASFPCTDLSLAGWRRGLSGSESSTFWGFTNVLDEMGQDARPPVVALENVVGFATSHGGEDLATAIRELNRLGYSADVLTLDARRFVPQSRPRLFVIGALNPPADEPVPNSELRPDWLLAPFGDPSLRTHRAKLPTPPPPLTSGLSDLVEQVAPDGWWEEKRRDAFLGSLSPMQAERLEKLKAQANVTYRTAYRRTRNGKPTWEIRPDDISGCLRTARGGSSKQAVVEVGNGAVRVRWMTPLEYARLMGAGNYTLDNLRSNQVLFGFGDAVCVPVVSWLAKHYLVPLVLGSLQTRTALKLAVVNG